MGLPLHISRYVFGDNHKFLLIYCYIRYIYSYFRNIYYSLGRETCSKSAFLHFIILQVVFRFLHEICLSTHPGSNHHVLILVFFSFFLFAVLSCIKHCSCWLYNLSECNKNAFSMGESDAILAAVLNPILCII